MIDKSIQKLVDYYKARTTYEDIIIHAESNRIVDLDKFLWDTNITIFDNVVKNRPCVYLTTCTHEELIPNNTPENHIWLDITEDIDWNFFQKEFNEVYYA